MLGFFSKKDPIKKITPGPPEPISDNKTEASQGVADLGEDSQGNVEVVKTVAPVKVGK